MELLCVSVCLCIFQLNTVGVKPGGERLKKPMSEKHQTNAAAVTGVVAGTSTVTHSSAQAPPLASDANVSTLSLVSVGPYEDFAVSIMSCLLLSSVSASSVLVELECMHGFVSVLGLLFDLSVDFCHCQ